MNDQHVCLTTEGWRSCPSDLCEGVALLHARTSDLLRDKDATRAALAELTNKELGVVLGLVLKQLDDRGDTPLPEFLRVLSSQVDDIIKEM